MAGSISQRCSLGLEIAQAAVNALNWTITMPKNALTVTVSDGWLTLKGTVAWQYQRPLQK